MRGNPDIKSAKMKKMEMQADRKRICKNANLQYSLSCLTKENEELKFQLEKTVEQYEQKINQLKLDFWEIIKKKDDENQQKILEIENDYIYFPKNTFNDYPIVNDMIKYSLGGTPSDDFLHFCQFFFLLNQNAYAKLCDFIPLIPNRTLFDSFVNARNKKRNQLLFPNEIPFSLENYYMTDKTDDPIHITLGGDAASIKIIPESGNSAIYVHMALPLRKDLKPIPLNITPTTNGSSNQKIVGLSKYITNIIEKNGRFVIDFIATDGDKGFDSAHRNFFSFIEPILNSNETFIKKIEKMLGYIHIPVNDGLHLLKNGRSHLLNHPMMIDPDTMRCVNMELFQEATNLNKELNDRSSIASMKDYYALSLFSWETFYNLILHKRFDGAFYVLPFVYFLQTIKSDFLNRDERLQLLELAVKYLTFHLKNVRKSKSTDFFTPSYTQKSLGTLFGEEIFIIRFINTCVALSIALLRQDEVAFSRICTHDIEGFFGMIRALSYYNYSFENALRASVNSCLLKDVCASLNYKFKIRSRINESGLFIKSDILNSKSHEINFEIIADSIFLLLRGIEISHKQIEMLVTNLNRYNKFIEFNPRTKIVRYQSPFSGTCPFYRQVTNSYVMSMLPLPNISSNFNSPFSFYNWRTKNLTKNLNKISTLKWFNQFFETVLQLINHNELIDIPQFPQNDEEEESDSEYIKKLIFEWINAIITKSNEMQVRVIDFNSTIIKSVDNDFKVKEEEAFDITKLPDLLNCKYIVRKKPPRPFNKEIKENEKEKFNSRINSVISSFVKYRYPVLKSLTKNEVKNKLKNDLKKLIDLLSIDNEYNISEALNSINLEKCMVKPINHNEEANTENILSSNDIDILSNRFDFNNDEDQFNQNE